MVWIHGGALTRGTGATSFYDGAALARKGAVVVTINYRLGVFGFLAHPALSQESALGVSGNYGFLDQVAALRWVRDHIDVFGGDPDRVTIFGESAGSWSVNTLQVLPVSEGLFHRAIGQSGAVLAPVRALRDEVHGMQSAESLGTELAASLSAPTLDALRALPAHVVLEAASAQEWPTSPVVDGVVLPDQPGTLFSEGRQHDVPVMAGFNKDEGTSLTAPAWRPQEPQAWEQSVRARFDTHADAMLEVYPAETPEASFLDAFRDEWFGWQTTEWANRMQNVDSQAWVYYFTQHPPVPGSDQLRAFHAAEIAYAFGNHQLFEDTPAQDVALAEMMSDYWVSFAEDGDPNRADLPSWEAWDPARRNYLEFGPEVRSGEALIEQADGFWSSLPDALRVP